MPDPYWEKVAEEKRKADALRALAARPVKEAKHIGNAGRKKWVCSECKVEQYEHWVVLNRAARPRCPGCGSLSYSPKRREARVDMVDVKDIRKDFKGPTGTGSGHFVVGS